MSTLAKASPAFAQQLVIINKSLLLFLRPIGDILAKFVRPMSLWMIKFATRWYQLFGTGDAGNQDPAAIVDEIAGLKSELVSAEAGGDTARVAEISGKISQKEAQLGIGGGGELSIGQKFMQSMNEMSTAIDKLFGGWLLSFEDLKTASSKFWTELIPEAFKETLSKLGETFGLLWEIAKGLFEVLQPVLAPLWEIVKIFSGAVLLGALTVINEALTIFNDLLKLGVLQIDLTMQAITWLWEKLKELTAYVKEWGFLAAVKKVFNDAVSWLKSLNPFKKDKDKSGKAVGGNIGTTGMYQLHAGERVLTAGENSRASGGTSANITNNIKISATINNDMDIRILARKLAEYSEGELRRRVSYI